jgi:hypothetical protein
MDAVKKVSGVGCQCRSRNSSPTVRKGVARTLGPSVLRQHDALPNGRATAPIDYEILRHLHREALFGKLPVNNFSAWFG